MFRILRAGQFGFWVYFVRRREGGADCVAGLNEKGALVRLEARPVWLDESGFGKIPSAEKKQEMLARFRGLSAEIKDGLTRVVLR